MKTAEQAFLKSIDLFKKIRIRALELEYDEQKKDVENNKRIYLGYRHQILRHHDLRKDMIVNFRSKALSHELREGPFSDKHYWMRPHTGKMCHGS